MRRGGPASAATRALNDSTSSAHPRRDCRLHATVGMLSSRRVAAALGVAVATHQAEATRSAPPSRAPGLHPPLPLRRRCSPSAWAVLPARAARLERSRPASSRSAVAAVARNANRHRRSVHCLRGPVHHAAPRRAAPHPVGQFRRQQRSSSSSNNRRRPSVRRRRLPVARPRRLAMLAMPPACRRLARARATEGCHRARRSHASWAASTVAASAGACTAARAPEA